MHPRTSGLSSPPPIVVDGGTPWSRRSALRRATAWCALIGVSVANVLTTHRLAADRRLPEFRLKALCLFNFGKLIGWPPPHALTENGRNAEFRIGVVGQSSTAQEIVRYLHDLEGKSINGRSVRILALNADAELSNLQILYVPQDLSSQWPQFLKKTRNQPVLTVGDRVNSFPTSGVMFNLLIEAEVLTFEINLEAASGFTINPNLSELGRVVKPVRKQP